MLKYLVVFFISMVPILELRGAIPIALGMDIPYIPAMILCVIGNMLPVPFVYMFGRTILKWGTGQKVIGGFCEKVLEKGEKAGRRIVNATGRGGTFVALMLFVGIPLPGTGAWTGSLGASFLNMGMRSTALSVSLGVIMAGTIMATVSLLGLHIFGL